MSVSVDFFLLRFMKIQGKKELKAVFFDDFCALFCWKV